MELSYFGYSCFRLKHGNFSLITDPFDPGEVGLPLGKHEADVVVYTQDLSGKGVLDKVRQRIILSDQRTESELKTIEVVEPGEYEVGGIFVLSYGYPTFHVINVEDVNICYLGLLKEKLESKQLDELGAVDYLIIPVGDSDTFVDWEIVSKLIKEIEPSYVIPSCYKLDGMKGDLGKLKSLEEYLRSIGLTDAEKVKKLKLEPTLQDEEHKTKYVVLEPIG